MQNLHFYVEYGAMGFEIFLRNPYKKYKRSFYMPKFTVKVIVASGIGAALFFVVGRFASIPSPVPNTFISLQYAILGLFAVLFGPIAGILVGFVGHALIDFTGPWGLWWSWIIASGFVGLILGFSYRTINIESGKFGKAQIIKFNVAQVIAHLIAWLAIAPTLDILIYAEPANKVFTQGAFAAGSNIVTTGIVGTLLLIAYAKTVVEKGSLKRE